MVHPEILLMQNLSFQNFLGLRSMFYLVSYNETTFEHVEDVPNYFKLAVPWFTIIIVLEIIYSVLGQKRFYTLGETMTSFHAGFLAITFKLLFYDFDLKLICWVHENYGFHYLPWNSIWTWLLSFVFVDFSYYWFHRAAHEINILWAFHQIHHSSQDYNLCTAFRQSVFQSFVEILFHVPESLILPPPVVLAHVTINKLNQFWVHTQTIKTLGPLEHILVTASHHRVHHGRNPYCIDKNYSGTFIIWDKIFGTFQPENPEESVAYGLVHQEQSYNPFNLQFDYFKHLRNKMLSMETFADKLKVFIFGPGWSQGKPRLGNLSDIPNVESYDKISDNSSNNISDILLLLANLIFIFFGYQTIVFYRESMSFLDVILCFMLLSFSVTCSSARLENKSYVRYLELVRSLAFCYMVDKIPWSIHPFLNFLVATFAKPIGFLCAVNYSIRILLSCVNRQ